MGTLHSFLIHKVRGLDALFLVGTSTQLPKRPAQWANRPLSGRETLQAGPNGYPILTILRGSC